MNKKTVTDLSSSVHARLLTQAKLLGRSYNELSQRYFMERFLYRLSQSPHVARFCLKGALMFVAWNAPTFRPTKDIDLLGHVECSIESLVVVFRDICRQTVVPDGLEFDPDSVQGEPIAEDAEYGGIRILLTGHFYRNARVSIQVDIGFGDKVVPAPQTITFKPILDFPAPSLKGYSQESSIAEKFDAMAKRGEKNSRMKDYYDIWFLSQSYPFKGAILAKAMIATRDARGRTVESAAAALTPAFVEKNRKTWQNFVRRSSFRDVPDDFDIVVTEVKAFLEPVVAAIQAGNAFVATWNPKGPWI